MKLEELRDALSSVADKSDVPNNPEVKVLNDEGELLVIKEAIWDSENNCLFIRAKWDD